MKDRGTEGGSDREGVKNSASRDDGLTFPPAAYTRRQATRRADRRTGGRTDGLTGWDTLAEIAEKGRCVCVCVEGEGESL